LTNQVLESCVDLAGASWSTVTNEPAVDAQEDWSVRVDGAAARRFFRLRKQ
jgi:hypothetical protein